MPSKMEIRAKSPEEIKTDEDRIKKEAEKKKQLLKKEKTYFDVKLEALVPCALTYRVYAFDEQEALLLVDKQPPTSIKPNVQQKRKIKATVYNAGSSMIRFIKNFKV